MRPSGHCRPLRPRWGAPRDRPPPLWAIGGRGGRRRRLSRRQFVRRGCGPQSGVWPPVLTAN
eukprot:7568196-Alexandrium_andersonii.AAC.1